ncbi:hypothetical protein K438DRAFT_1962248 [Mycena galopus ATCC 62051]|nr:hypothetical protein K438DRAFT_1962248 [Mycena galopus ATCC 62051]
MTTTLFVPLLHLTSLFPPCVRTGHRRELDLPKLQYRRTADASRRATSALPSMCTSSSAFGLIAELPLPLPIVSTSTPRREDNGPEMAEKGSEWMGASATGQVSVVWTSGELPEGVLAPMDLPLASSVRTPLRLQPMCKHFRQTLLGPYLGWFLY